MRLIRFAAMTCAICVGQSSARETDTHPLDSLRNDAESLRQVYQSTLAQTMLDEVQHLPICQTKTIQIAVRPNRGYTQAQFDALPNADREGLQAFEVKPEKYYSTFYGTPLVYARMLDLVAQYQEDFDMRGATILDLGYGQIGQLRLWAQMGAHVTGVEIDPILTAMYDACAAVGDVDDAPHSGHVRLIECSWPNDPDCRQQVGAGYDLIVSRNLLKRGYVKPETLNPAFPVPVGWEMNDAEVLGIFFDALAPGGLLIIESLGPKPDQTKPWSDISNPWSRAAWQAAGFEVLAHDADESTSVRAMGNALGWDEGMDLDENLFGVYSVYRRPVVKNADARPDESRE